MRSMEMYRSKHPSTRKRQYVRSWCTHALEKTYVDETTEVFLDLARSMSSVGGALFEEGEEAANELLIVGMLLPFEDNL
jgi:hypothetical protein